MHLHKICSSCFSQPHKTAIASLLVLFVQQGMLRIDMTGGCWFVHCCDCRSALSWADCWYIVETLRCAWPQGPCGSFAIVHRFKHQALQHGCVLDFKIKGLLYSELAVLYLNIVAHTHWACYRQ
jgi:hypothetical protein